MRRNEILVDGLMIRMRMDAVCSRRPSAAGLVVRVVVVVVVMVDELHPPRAHTIPGRIIFPRKV